MPYLENEHPTTNTPALCVRRLLGVVLWGLSLGSGVVWFNSLPAHSSNETPLADYTNSPAIALARANVVTFRYHAPHREFIEDAIPWGGHQPAGLTLYLLPNWKQQTSATKARITRDWKQFWEKNAHSLPASRTRPQLVLRQERSTIWHFSPSHTLPQPE